MTLLKALIKNTITLCLGVVGALWAGFIGLNSFVDVKVATAKDTMRIERQAQIGTLDEKIDGVSRLVQSIDKKLDILITKEK